jgi:hypothetical protein
LVPLAVGVRRYGERHIYRAFWEAQMLYLIKPDGTAEWTDSIQLSNLGEPLERGVDLTTIDWWRDDTDLRSTGDAVRIALRHGVAGERGIVVDGWPVVAVRRPNELRRTFAESEAARLRARPAMEAVDKFIDENLSPGWIGYGRDLDEKIKGSSDASIAEAEAEAGKLLSAPVRDHLVAAWTALRGVMPDPL